MQNNKVSLTFIILALFSILLYPAFGHAAYYKYDALNRLIRVYYDTGKVVKYSYDEVGNRIELDSDQSFTITATAGSNGSISPKGMGLFAAGESQSYTITPDTGYTIADVRVDGISVGAVTSYIFSEIGTNHDIAAAFLIKTFTVTPASDTNGTISPNVPQTVNYNTPTSFTVTPKSGYSISSVTGCGGVLSGTTYTTGPITDDCKVNAIFATHTHTVPGSSLILSLGEATYPAGGTVIPILTNTSTQDISAQYTFSIYDANSTLIATASDTQTIQAEASLPISLTIPSSTLDGAYTVKARYQDTQTGIVAETAFPVTIIGVKATLSVQTKQQTYAVTQNIMGLSAIDNTGVSLQDGNLHLQVGESPNQKTWKTQSDWQQGIRSGVDTFELPGSVRLTSFSDSFNGGYLDTDRWNPVASAAGGAAPTVDNGRLYMVMPNGGWQASYVDTKVPINGDFDVEVSYEVDSTNYSNGNNHPAGLVVWQTNGFYLWVDLWGSMTYGSYDYPYGANNAGGGQYTGKFRIRRIGSFYSTFYWNGRSWSNLLNSYGRPAGPAYVRVLVNGQNGNVRTHFDNFTVTTPATSPTGESFPASGTIRLKYDSGVIDTWDKLNFTADTPQGTSIIFRTRTADTEAGLNNSPWSSYITTTGSSITSPKSRWIEVEATLGTSNAANTPVLHDITVTQGIKSSFLLQVDVPVSMTANTVSNLESSIGALSAPGNYYLKAILTSLSTNQTIATAEYPFLVTAQSPSTTTVNSSSSSNTSTYDESVSFTATVSSVGGIPAGTVQFQIDGVNFGNPVSLTGGSATSGSISSLNVGQHTISAVYGGSTNFTSSSGTLSHTVKQATPKIIWNNPAEITYGYALDATQLNATSSVPGTFSYTPAIGTVLNAGNGQILKLDFTPTDTANYTSATTTVQINIAKATPTIKATGGIFTYDGLPHAATGVVLGLNGVNLGEPIFTYTPGGTQTPLNAGTYTAVGSFSGNDNYTASTNSTDIVINKADQTITFEAMTDKLYGDAPFILSAAASSGLAVNFSAVGNCSMVDTTVTISSAGKCTITASQSGNENFNAAPPVSRTFSIAKATQTISWNSPADIVYGTALGSTQLNAVVSVVGPAPAGVLTYNPAAGTILEIGTSSLTVNAAETDNYLSATKVVPLMVKYGIKGLQPPYDSTKAYKIGRAIPIKWQYISTTGAVLTSSTANPGIVITKGSDTITSNNAIILDDSGNSGYQYDNATNTWQYNWKTTELTVGIYYIHIKSTLTGQTDGPYMIQLSK